jgi:hypothetical protein
LVTGDFGFSSSPGEPMPILVQKGFIRILRAPPSTADHENEWLDGGPFGREPSSAIRPCVEFIVLSSSQGDTDRLVVCAITDPAAAEQTSQPSRFFVKGRLRGEIPRYRRHSAFLPGILAAQTSQVYPPNRARDSRMNLKSTLDSDALPFHDGIKTRMARG